jgi:hypothetical protein
MEFSLQGGEQFLAVTTAVPSLPTTMPAAMLATRMASSQAAPAASMTARVAMTVSPAPDTSNTSCALPADDDFVSEQGHPLFAPGDQQGLQTEVAAQLARLGSELFVLPATDHLLQFERFGVITVAPAYLPHSSPLGSTSTGLSGGAGDADHFRDVGQPALAIVGQDDHIGVGYPALEIGQLGLQDLVRRRRFEIDTQQLLLTADDAQFDDGVDIRVDMQPGIDLPFLEQTAQGTPGIVIADDRQQRRPAPSEAALRATLAAPPRRSSCRSTLTTGTGASGEMRLTSPNQ